MEEWSVEKLSSNARGISASRRTDIPALFAEWFSQRLETGFVKYIPAGPPRTVRCQLSPELITHFTFWSRWPKPFLSTVEELRRADYPVLFHYTLTGLGGTPVEPGVPETEQSLATLEQLSELLPEGAICWRYDPLFITDKYDLEYHREQFRKLANRMPPKISAVVISCLDEYGRMVQPELERYEAETGDQVRVLETAMEVELAGELAAIAANNGLELSLCCEPELCAETGLPATGCNSWARARKVYPELSEYAESLSLSPTREGCRCSEEVDIGVYNICPLGCRYCYASKNQSKAQRRYSAHKPEEACLYPEV